MTVLKEQARKWIGVVLLMAMDLLVYAFSLCLAHGLRVALNKVVTIQFNTPFRFYIALWWIPFIFIAVYVYEGLYTRRSPYWDEVGRLLRADFLGTWAVFAILTLLKMSEQYSRLLLVLMGIFLVLLHPLVRLWGKRFLFYSGIWREKVAIWGVGPLAVSVAEALTHDRHLGFDVIGFISSHATDKSTVETSDGRNFPVLGTLDQAIQSRAVTRTTQMAFADEELDHEDATAKLNEMIRYFHSVLVVPSSLKIPVLNTEPLYLFQDRTIILKINNNLYNPVSRFFKRALDIFLTVLALPVVLVISCVIGMLIKLESKGPILFAHDRVGRGGKRIKVLKFRTMYEDAQDRLEALIRENPAIREEWLQNFKLKNDPRITGLGHFLRKTSLDELPQFFNVLFGDMSLVGPRPVIEEELRAYYADKKGAYLAVCPGISGLWQISGRNDVDYQNRVFLDEWYVTNWTVWLDVEILIKTIAVVLKRDGAY